MTALPVSPNHHGPRYYRGDADGAVHVEGRDGTDGVPLNPRFDLRNHSPTGFNWGYAGSGPAQLALALVADALGNDNLALSLHQRFKSRFVARLPTGEAWGPIAAEEIRLEVAELIAEPAAHRG